MAIRTLNVRLTADITNLTAGLARAGVAINRMSGQMVAAGERMQQVGQTITTRITLPLVVLSATLLKTAGDFQAAMIQVQALSNATGVQLDRLRQKAQYLGMTTKFTATDAANALSFMSMAGMRAADSLNALPYVLQLAASSGLDMARSADIVTNVLAGYRLGVDDLAHSNDVLVSTFTATNTNLEQLGEAMKYAGPVAAAAGVQFEEAAAMIGLMGNAGIQGSMAGTSLRGAISRLVAPTDQIKAAMEAAGLSVTDSEGRLRSFVDIVRQLEPHANDAGLMMTIFGQRAGPALAAVVSQGSDALERLIVRLELADGTAARIADSYNQGFNGAMYSLQSAVEAAGLAFGRSGLLDNMERMIRQIVDLFRALSELNPVWLRAITTIAAMAIALGPLLLVIGAVTKALGALGAALLGPGGVLIAIAGLAVALTAGAWFKSLAAEARGVETAMENAAVPMQTLNTLLAQMATTAGEAREALSSLALQQVQTLNAQASADEAAARAAEAEAARFRMNSGILEQTGVMATSPEGRAAREARARATQSHALAQQAGQQFFEADFAPQRQAEFERAYLEYVRARESRPEGQDETQWREEWMRRNRRVAGILRRGPSTQANTRAGALIPEMDILDLSGLGDSTGNTSTPTERRDGEIATLRALSGATADTAREMQRLTDIQTAMNEAVAGGEHLTREQAEAFVDERDALQSVIDKQNAAIEAEERAFEVSKEMTVQLEQDRIAREQLTEAANQGVHAYERMVIVQDLLRRNPALTQEEAGRIADDIQRSNEALERATSRMNSFQQMWDSIGQAVGSAFEKAILDGEKLGDVLKSLARDIAALILRQTVTQPLANMISNLFNGGSTSGGSSGGGFWSSILGSLGGIFNGGGIGGGGTLDFVGGFAEGGFIPPGKWGYTGEEGIEKVYGGKTGATIFPNNDNASGAVIVDARTYIDAAGADPAALARVQGQLSQLERDLPKIIQGRVANMNSRGRGWTP